MRVTKGFGLLEFFLAKQRARIANKIIGEKEKNGRLLDVGCGSYPIFLLTSKFVEKFGVDKIDVPNSVSDNRFKLINYDIEKNNKIPFGDNFIDVVTALAVFEHIEYYSLTNIILEIYRVLKPGGIFIITIPSTWTEIILKIMSHLYLISKEELRGHKSNFNNMQIIEILQLAGFNNIKSGYFEFFMNRWFRASK